MTYQEMLNYNPDSRIILYNEIKNYKNINDLFNNKEKIIILYIMQVHGNHISGHWTCLFKNEDKNEIHFFDSYGLEVDSEEKYVPLNIVHKYYEDYAYLSDLLNNSTYNITHSKYKLQAPHVETCGRHVTLRLHNVELNDKQYYDCYFKNKIDNPDIIVSKIIN